MQSTDNEKRWTDNCTNCDKQIEVPDHVYELYMGTVFCSARCEDEFIEEWK